VTSALSGPPGHRCAYAHNLDQDSRCRLDETLGGTIASPATPSSRDTRHSRKWDSDTPEALRTCRKATWRAPQEAEKCPKCPKQGVRELGLNPQPPLRFDELGLRPILREAAAVDNPSNRPKKRRIPRWIKADVRRPPRTEHADTTPVGQHAEQAQNQPKPSEQPKVAGPDHRNRQVAESRAEHSLQWTADHFRPGTAEPSCLPSDNPYSRVPRTIPRSAADVAGPSQGTSR